MQRNGALRKREGETMKYSVFATFHGPREVRRKCLWGPGSKYDAEAAARMLRRKGTWRGYRIANVETVANRDHQEAVYPNQEARRLWRLYRRAMRKAEACHG
jgi:hypothetical protein